MNNYEQNTGAGGQRVGMGTKIKDAVTPGHHNTGEYIGERGGLNAPTTGGNNSGYGNNAGGMGANPMTTGNTGTGIGGTGVGNTGYNQGATTGMGGGGRTGLTNPNQSGMSAGGVGGGVAGHMPQEQYEKTTHNTHDHDESESHETSTKRL